MKLTQSIVYIVRLITCWLLHTLGERLYTVLAEVMIMDQMSNSESRPRKVELTLMHSKNASLHITTKHVVTPALPH